ncbi:hypothetical protein Gotur_032699 [Gossypium turneri]
MLKGKHLYWTSCAAHCLDLCLEDIGKKPSVAKVLDEAKKEFKESKWGQQKSGPAYEGKKIVLGILFWKKANDLIKVYEPLVKVLRLVDSDEKPTMTFIYEAVDRAKRAIQQDCRYFTEYEKIIDNRWNFMHFELHSADGENAGVLPVDTSDDEIDVDQSQQQNLSHSSSSSTPSQNGDGDDGGGLSPIDEDDRYSGDRGEISLLVSMEENMGLVPLVDISMLDQSLMEICFLNLGEREVNLELHQKEKARSILL